MFNQNINNKNPLSATEKIFLFLKKEYQILQINIKLFLRENGFLRASALSFSTLLYLVPLLAVFFMVFKVFGGKTIVNNWVKPFIYSFLTPVGGKQFSGYIDRFINSATIETLGTIGVFFLFFGVFSILSQIEDNFNVIWNIRKNRSPLEKMKVYWLIMTILPLLMALSLAISSYVDFVMIIGENLLKGFSSFIIFDLLPFFLIFCFFFATIKIIPNCLVNFNSALISSLFGSVLYFLSKYLFIAYSKMAVSYDIVYGSLSILPIFMLWVYFFWNLILLSVQMAFVRQNYPSLINFTQEQNLSHTDEYKIAFIVCLKMISDYLNGKEAEHISAYSEQLHIPLHYLNDTFFLLEKNQMIRETETKTGVYLPNIPLKDFSLLKIIESVDRSYLEDLNFNENYDHLLKKLLADLKVSKMTGLEKNIADFIRQE